MSGSLLLLSGGGARGAYQVAPIQHIVEHHGVDAVYGTSVGAVNGAAVASLKSHILEGIWRDIDGVKSFQRFNIENLWKGLYDFDPLRRLLRKHEVLEPKIPFYVGAFDYAKLRQKLIPVNPLGEEDALRAIIVSSAIAGLHEATKFRGRWMGDGGLDVPLPLPRQKWKGYSEIHAVFCSPSSRPPILPQRSVNGAVEQVSRFLDLVLHKSVLQAHQKLSRWKREMPEIDIFVYEPQHGWDEVKGSFDARKETIRNRLEHGKEMVLHRTELVYPRPARRRRSA